MSSKPPGNDDVYRPPNVESSQFVVSRGNGMAVASLVCGLLCCITPIPSILAVVFGVIGIRRSRNPYSGGGAMAASGLTLGIVGVVLWAITCTGFGFLLRYVMDERDAAEKTAETFVQRVVDGKLDEAMSLALPSVDRKSLIAHAERAKPWGPLSYLRAEYKPEQGPVSASNQLNFRWIIEGNAIFSRASPAIKMSVIKEGKTYKVEQFDMKQ